MMPGRVAGRNNASEAQALKRRHYQWLLQSGQDEQAARVKERDGDFVGAITLFLQGGLPAKAAQVNRYTRAILHQHPPCSSTPFPHSFCDQDYLCCACLYRAAQVNRHPTPFCGLHLSITSFGTKAPMLCMPLQSCYDYLVIMCHCLSGAWDHHRHDDGCHHNAPVDTGHTWRDCHNFQPLRQLCVPNTDAYR